MAQYKFEAQNNVGFPQTFNMSVPAPLIANRIFETLADAENFLNQPTCIPGLILRVIKDTDNNAAYRVGYQTGNDGPLALFRLSEGQGGQENVIEHVFVKTDDEPVELEVTDKGVTIDLSNYVTSDQIVDKFVKDGTVVRGYFDPEGNFVEDPVGNQYLKIILSDSSVKPIYISLQDLVDVYDGETADESKKRDNINDPDKTWHASIQVDKNNRIYVDREWLDAKIREYEFATNTAVDNAISNFKTDVIDPLLENKANQSDLDDLTDRVEALEQQTCPVQDVQVNGTSVVENGIANIIIGDYATKEELEEVEGKIPTREDIEGIAGPLTDQKIDATVGVQYEPDESRRILTVKNGEKTTTIRNAIEKDKTERGTLWSASNDDETLYYLQVENVLYPSNESGERLEPAVGEELSISAETKTEATGLYGAMQGNTRITIAQLAAEVKQLSGGEAVGIKYINGENATWKGEEDYVNIHASEPIDNAVSLTSKVKTANASINIEDGKITYEDGLMTSRDFEIMTSWTVLN